MWFVGFCFLANQWQVSEDNQFKERGDAARAAITFSFFSIFTWVRTLMAWCGAVTKDGTDNLKPWILFGFYPQLAYIARELYKCVSLHLFLVLLTVSDMWTHDCTNIVPTGGPGSLLYGEVKECVIWRGIHQAVPSSASSVFCLTLSSLFVALTICSRSYTLLFLYWDCTWFGRPLTANTAVADTET